MNSEVQPEVQTGIAADELTSKTWAQAISAPPIDENEALAESRVASADGWFRLVNGMGPAINPIAPVPLPKEA